MNSIFPYSGLFPVHSLMQRVLQSGINTFKDLTCLACGGSDLDLLTTRHGRQIICAGCGAWICIHDSEELIHTSTGLMISAYEDLYEDELNELDEDDRDLHPPDDDPDLQAVLRDIRGEG